MYHISIECSECLNELYVMDVLNRNQFKSVFICECLHLVYLSDVPLVVQ
jgi:hypothetical protein